MPPIDHAFIETKRREIAAIERNARALPNAFFDVYAAVAKATGETRATAKRRIMTAPYGKRATRKGGKR